MVKGVVHSANGDYERNHYTRHSYEAGRLAGLHSETRQDQLVHRFRNGGFPYWGSRRAVHVQLEGAAGYGHSLVFLSELWNRRSEERRVGKECGFWLVT